jgi:hypothetical protein
VAQGIPAYPAVRCLFDHIPEPKISISRGRSTGRWNGQRDRPAVDDR